MVWSFLVRVGMFAVTMGVIAWIGWSVPQSREELSGEAQSAERVEQSVPMALAAVPSAEPPMSAVVRREPAASLGRTRATGLVDLNRASEQELEALPGIGPVLAGRIVAYRREAGAFHRVEDLRSVKGIGKKKLEKIKALVSVAPSSKMTSEGKKTI